MENLYREGTLLKDCLGEWMIVAIDTKSWAAGLLCTLMRLRDGGVL